MNRRECILRFLLELEQLIPEGDTRYMISATMDGKLEIRIGSGDWYRLSNGTVNDPDPMPAAEQSRTGYELQIPS